MTLRLTFAYSGEIGAVTIQWFLDGVLISNGTFGPVTITGATTTTLVIEGLTEDYWGPYTAVATDAGGCVADTDSFQVGCFLTLTTDPTDAVAEVGDEATFMLAYEAPGSIGPFEVQWFKDDVALVDGVQGDGSTVAGATTTILTITNVQVDTAGVITATVTDESFPHCTVTTDGVLLCIGSGTGCCFPPCGDLTTAWTTPIYVTSLDAVVSLQAGKLRVVKPDCTELNAFDYGARGVNGTGAYLAGFDPLVYYFWIDTNGVISVSKLNASTGAWTDVQLLTGGDTGAVGGFASVLVLPGGPIWVGTGTMFTNRMAFIYDPATDSTTDVPRPIDAQTNLPDGLFIGGGTGISSCMAYNPSDGMVWIAMNSVAEGGSDPVWLFKIAANGSGPITVLKRFFSYPGVVTLGYLGMVYVPTFFTGYMLHGIQGNDTFFPFGPVRAFQYLDTAGNTIAGIDLGSNGTEGVCYSSLADRVMIVLSSGFLRVSGPDLIEINSVTKFVETQPAITPSFTVFGTFDAGTSGLDPAYVGYCLRPYTTTELDTHP